MLGAEAGLVPLCADVEDADRGIGEGGEGEGCPYALAASFSVRTVYFNQ